MSRTIADIPERQLACYEWKDVSLAARRLKSGDVVCVSLPFDEGLRAIAKWEDGKFFLAETNHILKGVTYFAHCPMTPEDCDAEQAALKKSPSPSTEPELALNAA